MSSSYCEITAKKPQQKKIEQVKPLFFVQFDYIKNVEN